MQTIILKTAPELKRIVLAAFPDYRKTKVFVSAWSGRMNVNSYWDGGSRDQHAAVGLETGRAKQIGGGHPFFDVTRAGQASSSAGAYETDHVGNVTLIDLPVGVAIVSAGTFCGKPATAHIRLHPDNLAKLLPAAI